MSVCIPLPHIPVNIQPYAFQSLFLNDGLFNSPWLTTKDWSTSAENAERFPSSSHLCQNSATSRKCVAFLQERLFGVHGDLGAPREAFTVSSPLGARGTYPTMLRHLKARPWPKSEYGPIVVITEPWSDDRFRVWNPGYSLRIRELYSLRMP